MNFIELSESISLSYEIPFNIKPLRKFYIDVNIQSLGKSEKQKKSTAGQSRGLRSLPGSNADNDGKQRVTQ